MCYSIRSLWQSRHQRRKNMFIRIASSTVILGFIFLLGLLVCSPLTAPEAVEDEVVPITFRVPPPACNPDVAVCSRARKGLTPQNF